MRVSICAMWVALAACSASSASPPDQPPSAADCKRAALPATLDPRSVSWQLVVPAHGPTQQRDMLLDACDSIVSLAHETRPGDLDAMIYGPNEVLVTTTGAEWSRLQIAGVDGATFFDVERRGNTWVAVGRTSSGEGVIAFADVNESKTWRQVFTSVEGAFQHVAFGAETFVAQSRSGVAFSRDAEHWSWAAVPEGKPYFDVAFGNGRFVAVGIGTALSSSDGQSWQTGSFALPFHRVSFVGDKFYVFGSSIAFESSDGMAFEQVKANVPHAAIGGVLVSMASDAETHWLESQQLFDPPQVFVSEDDGLTWFALRLTISSSEVDCSIEPCVVVPQGVLVLRPKGPQPGPLCDGSSDIRFMWSRGPGFAAVTDPFVAPYGHGFFAIDGTCHYYAQDNPAHAIVRGELTSEEATQLSSDLAWDELPGWQNFHPRVQCADAGGVTLGTQQVVIACGPSEEAQCGCGASAPAGLPTTLESAIRWHSLLVRLGVQLGPALGAIAVRGADASRPWQPWPLARSMASIPGLIVDPNNLQFDSGSYPRFDDPAETMLLRQLRDVQSEAAHSADHSFTVREGGEAFSLYLRDELPDADARAIATFKQSWSFE